MVYNIYSVRDVLVGFGPLLVEQSDPVAVRHFAQLSEAPNVPIRDYDLYLLGTFDLNSGVISSFPVPQLVCHGSDFVKEVSHETIKSE